MGRQRRIELTWRCSSCGHGNRGRDSVCASCGNPKDASERYDMPPDTRAAPSVTDPGALRLASAGPNWRCAYCGSDQRALDRSCAQCGASSDEGLATMPARTPRPPRPPQLRWLRRVPRWARVTVAVVVSTATLFGTWMLWPRTIDATVASVHWEHRVHVDRWRIWEREGFAEQIPGTALDREARGERHHHDEQVLDHYETETYTESVACGEDCSYVPESCSESCTDDGNGFATCTESCSGGGQSCTTRYCSEQRTREVPVYCSVPLPSRQFRARDSGVSCADVMSYAA